MEEEPRATAKAGWYQVPPDSPTLRWWDGQTWTDHRVAVPSDPTVIPPPPPGYSQAPDAAPPAAPAPVAKSLDEHLSEEATKFKGYSSLFMLLSLLGALGLGWVSAQNRVCDLSGFGGITCETETDGATFAIVAVVSFAWSMLFVLPLRGIAALLAGVASLLRHD